jgi:sugar (pentulose or hexulose) kinase
MGEPLILTFDLGTQSIRALLVNHQGGIVHKTQKFYTKPYHSKQPGWAEQYPAFYWDSFCEVSLSLKEKAGPLWQDIIAVTCATIRDTCLCLDKDYNPLRDVILWLDTRQAKNLSPLPALWDILIKMAGLSEGVDLQRRISTCNWIAENEKELWEKTSKFVFISTWLTYKLCGNLVDSTANIIGHIPFDSRNNCWMKDSDFRRLIFAVSKDKLFDLVEPGSVLGTITRKTAEETGITAALPLIATGSDKGCETLGLSCISEEKAAISFGTTATIQLSTKNYLEPLPNIPPYPAVLPGSYNPEIEIYRGYWLLSWFKKEFAAKESMDAQQLGISAENLLDSRLKEVQAGCDGLIMQPYFTPGIDMPFAKGAIIGFSDIHTRIHVYRAIIEGINFALIDGLRTMEKRGKFTTKALYVAGGGSQSSEVCRITASMFGLPLYRTQTHEVTGIGSSLAAFVAQGFFSSYEEGIKAMVHIKDEFIPEPREHEIYAQLYDKIFKKIFDKLSPLYKELTGIVG